VTTRNYVKRAIAIASVLIAVLLAAVLWAFPVLSQPPHDAEEQQNTSPCAEGVSNVTLSERDLARETLRDPKMASTLARIAEEAALAPGSEALSTLPTVISRDGRLQVELLIHGEDLPAVTRAVEGAGGQVTGAAAGHTIVQAWLAPETLQTVAGLDAVLYMRLPECARPLDTQDIVLPDAGAYTTQALTALNADTWHSAGYTGLGIKVAIIDGGFEGYPTLLGTELPPTVQAMNFVDGEDTEDVATGGVHGTACAEIVHDVAPDASLYLVKVATITDLEEAVTALVPQGIDVISTSIGWLTVAPGDGTGPLAEIVDAAHSAGITWVTAAGNYRERHWGGPFTDSDGDDILNVDGEGEVILLKYMLPSGISLEACVRWDDWTSVTQDYDLYLVRWNADLEEWDIIDGSENVQNGAPGQTPTEYVIAVTSGGTAAYGLIVHKYEGSGPTNFEMYTPGIELYSPVHGRSLCNLADAPGAITIGAVDWQAPFPQEPFSSEGPTNGAGGAAEGGALKPNLSAFDRVSTASYAPGVFAGTSASAPHAAGSVALVLAAYPHFAPDDVAAFLASRAIDMGELGVDTSFGFGRTWLGDPPLPLTPGPTATRTPTPTVTLTPTSTTTATAMCTPTSTLAATLPAPPTVGCTATPTGTPVLRRGTYLPMIWR